MATSTTIAREDQTDAVPDSARRCLVTGDVRPKDELIRFVVGPDHTIVPDLACNLPGRGLWVTADFAVIDQAARKNMFARAGKAEVKADPHLATQVAQLYKKRSLDLLGFAKSAGIGILGQMQVESALKAGKLALLLIADDAAASSLEKINPGTVPVIRSFTRHELGGALGYEQSVYVGLVPHTLTAKIRQTLEILAKVSPLPVKTEEKGA